MCYFFQSFYIIFSIHFCKFWSGNAIYRHQCNTRKHRKLKCHTINTNFFSNRIVFFTFLRGVALWVASKWDRLLAARRLRLYHRVYAPSTESGPMAYEPLPAVPTGVFLKGDIVAAILDLPFQLATRPAPYSHRAEEDVSIYRRPDSPHP